MSKCGYCQVELIEGEFCSDSCAKKRQDVRENWLMWFEATSTSIIREKIDPQVIDWRTLEENTPADNRASLGKLRALYGR